MSAWSMSRQTIAAYPRICLKNRRKKKNACNKGLKLLEYKVDINMFILYNISWITKLSGYEGSKNLNIDCTCLGLQIILNNYSF